MSDDLTPEEEGAIERLFASHPPLGLGMGWETELRIAMPAEATMRSARKIQLLMLSS